MNYYLVGKKELKEAGIWKETSPNLVTKDKVLVRESELDGKDKEELMAREVTRLEVINLKNKGELK